MCKLYEPRRTFVHRSAKDEWNPDFFVRSVKFGKYSVMVWGGVSYHHRTELVTFFAGEHINSERYLETIKEYALDLV